MPAPVLPTDYRGYSTIYTDKIRTIYDIELVKQDILNHFRTRKNERVGNCAYGSIIPDLLFELNGNDSAIGRQILEEARRIIEEDVRVQIIDLILNEFEYGFVLEAKLFYVGFQVQDDFKIVFDRNNIRNLDRDE